MMNDFDRYQAEARKTAVYPTHLVGIYPALGLCGEAGEVAEKIKKLHRDDHGVLSLEFLVALKKELGDVLWYVANLAEDYNISLSEVVDENLAKLYSRKARGVLKGSGDNR